MHLDTKDLFPSITMAEIAHALQLVAELEVGEVRVGEKLPENNYQKIFIVDSIRGAVRFALADRDDPKQGELALLDSERRESPPQEIHSDLIEFVRKANRDCLDIHGPRPTTEEQLTAVQMILAQWKLTPEERQRCEADKAKLLERLDEERDNPRR